MFRRRLKNRSIRIFVGTLAVTLAWSSLCTTSSWAQTEKTSSRPQLNKGAQDATTNIVAVVNGQSITRQELAQQCMERYGEQVVESLVNKHLILQACKQQGIRITNQDIENEIEAIATRFSLPKDRWLEMLQQERNINPEQYRRDIIWPTIALKQLATDELIVNDQELKDAFESEYGPKIQARMIATSDRAKAEKLLAAVKADPAEFGNLAKKHSEDPNSAAARGLIPHIRRHVGEPKVEAAAFALQPGEISEIVSVANQFLIFKCEKRLPATPISPAYRKIANEQLKERIIDRNLRDASTTIFQKLQQGAEVVNVYNDPSTRQKYPGVAAMINGQQITIRQLAEECIARHGHAVLDDEINHKLLRQSLDKAGKKVNEKDIDVEIARAAEAYGFITRENEPDIERWLEEVTGQEGIDVKTYIRDAVWPSVALKKLVVDDVKVTSEDLNRGFEANYGERVDVLAIVLSNQRVAQEVWDMARGNKNMRFFGELASQYSIEPVSRANLGEVPPVRRFSGQPAIEQEAFSLSSDDPLSAIVAVADKYIIMFYKGRTEPVVEELSVVQDELAKDLKEKKMRVAMAQRFDDIRDGAQIDNFLSGASQSGRTGRPQASTRTKASPASVKISRPASQSPKLIRPASRKTATQPE
ncbi:MAG: peptidylprolyl isomerase [Planctomycetaceae bacterium]|nr:peptidylprolyl isomerase [Planctomycetaceae bacterium]